MIRCDMLRSDLLCDVVSIKKRLLLFLIRGVGERGLGRARVPYGRKIELAQFALPRQQTTSKIFSERWNQIAKRMEIEIIDGKN